MDGERSCLAGGNLNLYGYVINDPINAIDPTGLLNNWWTAAGSVARAVIGFLCGGGSAAFAGPAAPVAVPAGAYVGAVQGSIIGAAAGAYVGNAIDSFFSKKTTSPKSCPRGLGNTTHASGLKPDEALSAAERWLGPGYRQIAPGIYRSADNLRQFRIVTSDLVGAHGTIGPHIHFEALNELGAVVENLHVPLAP